MRIVEDVEVGREGSTVKLLHLADINAATAAAEEVGHHRPEPVAPRLRPQGQHGRTLGIADHPRALPAAEAALTGARR
jgi:hypothetical protein